MLSTRRLNDIWGGGGGGSVEKLGLGLRVEV